MAAEPVHAVADERVRGRLLPGHEVREVGLCREECRRAQQPAGEGEGRTDKEKACGQGYRHRRACLLQDDLPQPEFHQRCCHGNAVATHGHRGQQERPELHVLRVEQGGEGKLGEVEYGHKDEEEGHAQRRHRVPAPGPARKERAPGLARVSQSVSQKGSEQAADKPQGGRRTHLVRHSVGEQEEGSRGSRCQLSADGPRSGSAQGQSPGCAQRPQAAHAVGHRVAPARRDPRAPRAAHGTRAGALAEGGPRC
mmetsp:Transcript_53700/g.166730  ORF Transcript_53700/g.166730 Transcript_53700/m.166730 type:complete len:253 (-) Transcript_53700:15-773(-)